MRGLLSFTEAVQTAADKSRPRTGVMAEGSSSSKSRCALDSVGGRGRRDSGFIIQPGQVKKAKEAIDFLSSIGVSSENCEEESTSSSDGKFFLF